MVNKIDAVIWPTNSHFETDSGLGDRHCLTICRISVAISTVVAAHPRKSGFIGFP